VKYYDYGVVSVNLHLEFETDLGRLWCASPNRWIAAPELEKCTSNCFEQGSTASSPRVVLPYSAWLSEDYYIIN